MKIRQITESDYEPLILFWKAHYFVNEVDDRKRFQQFLVMNPGLSLLVEDEGKILGTVLGSFDGRRGYIQKLVVHTAHRRRGIAKQLIKEVISKLHALGVLYIPLSVEKELTPFYESCGFKKTDQAPMNMSWSTFTYHSEKK